MSMLKQLYKGAVNADETIGPIRMNPSPFMGGEGRNAILALEAPIPASGSIVVQGHEGPDLPASNSPEWTTIVTLSPTSDRRTEIALPAWIRLNVGATGTGNVRITLEGVQ